MKAPLVRFARVALGLVVVLGMTAAAGPAPGLPPVIAILDTGIDPSHPEFSPGQVVAWKDFLHSAPAPYDDHGHGTGVASRAGGATLGGFPGAPLAIAKVLADDGQLRTSLAPAIRWAVDEAGARVVSVSIWSNLPVPLDFWRVNEAIAYATSKGAIVVWIAGNSGFATLPLVPGPSFLFPYGSNSPDALIVGAAADTGAPALNYATFPEVTAWGVRVPVATLGGGVEERSGTSYAAPYVAGAAARLLAAHPGTSPDRVERVLHLSARDGVTYPFAAEGYGLIDGSAVTRALGFLDGSRKEPDRSADDAQHAAVSALRGGLGRWPVPG